MPISFSLQRLWATLGPGLLYAGAAVGVSHLVMSTKAGAKYEFLLLLLIPLIHLIKYPFYKFGPYYTALTGRNILHGYYALGKWALALYMAMTLLSMCLIQAAVTLVTSSIAVTLFGVHLPAEYMPHIPAILLLIGAGIILYIGQYSLLSKMMKGVIIILAITTLASLALVWFEGTVPINKVAPNFSWLNVTDLLFLAAFLGWMPAPMDVSVWHSVWAEEANHETHQQADVQKTMLDFNIGFFGTAILAMVFLSLGALVMFGNGAEPSNNGAVFAGQIIQLYTEVLGDWAYPLIGIVALATMFSTALTCLDAYPRTLEKSYFIWKQQGQMPSIQNEQENKQKATRLYRLLLVLAVIGTIAVLFVIKNLSGAMGYIVMVATIVSFVSAPVLAYINFKVMQGTTIPTNHKPRLLLTLWSWIGIIIMSLFSLAYIILLIKF